MTAKNDDKPARFNSDGCSSDEFEILFQGKKSLGNDLTIADPAPTTVTNQPTKPRPGYYSLTTDLSEGCHVPLAGWLACEGLGAALQSVGVERLTLLQIEGQLYLNWPTQLARPKGGSDPRVAAKYKSLLCRKELAQFMSRLEPYETRAEELQNLKELLSDQVGEMHRKIDIINRKTTKLAADSFVNRPTNRPIVKTVSTARCDSPPVRKTRTRSPSCRSPTRPRPPSRSSRTRSCSPVRSPSPRRRARSPRPLYRGRFGSPDRRRPSWSSPDRRGSGRRVSRPVSRSPSPLPTPPRTTGTFMSSSKFTSVDRYGNRFYR